MHVCCLHVFALFSFNFVCLFVCLFVCCALFACCVVVCLFLCANVCIVAVCCLFAAHKSPTPRRIVGVLSRAS